MGRQAITQEWLGRLQLNLVCGLRPSIDSYRTGHGWGTSARANVQTNHRFRISGTAARIALKFGVWLETNYLNVLHEPRVGYICTCTHAYSFSYLGNG